MEFGVLGYRSGGFRVWGLSLAYRVAQGSKETEEAKQAMEHFIVVMYELTGALSSI